MDWKKVWELPLKRDEYSGYYAWGSNGTMALTCDSDDQNLLTEIVDAINGTKPFSRGGVWTAKGCDIYCDGEYIMCARGWGELTSPSCLGLTVYEATSTQDDFIRYIISKLNL